MKKQLLKLLLFGFITIPAFAQETNKNNFSLGIFVGEGTGILTNFSFNDKLGIEWNIAYNELFYKYKYTDKNPNITNQRYNNIHSSSLLLNYKNNFFGINKLNYRFAIGGQMRLISGFHKDWRIPTPPNTYIIDEPTVTNEIKLGVTSLIGAEYCINKNISAFLDLGVYSEIIDAFLWTNFQFRTGFTYNINCKKQ
ncbi:MAG: hypothetical protein GX259_09470 [Bacteroidales bacterium]|nr:hypothetical protein [Bacteroidales bacterium]